MDRMEDLRGRGPKWQAGYPSAGEDRRIETGSDLATWLFFAALILLAVMA